MDTGDEDLRPSTLPQYHLKDQFIYLEKLSEECIAALSDEDSQWTAA